MRHATKRKIASAVLVRRTDGKCGTSCKRECHSPYGNRASLARRVVCAYRGRRGFRGARWFARGIPPRFTNTVWVSSHWAAAEGVIKDISISD